MARRRNIKAHCSRKTGSNQFTNKKKIYTEKPSEIVFYLENDNILQSTFNQNKSSRRRR